MLNLSFILNYLLNKWKNKWNDNWDLENCILNQASFKNKNQNWVYIFHCEKINEMKIKDTTFLWSKLLPKSSKLEKIKYLKLSTTFPFK